MHANTLALILGAVLFSVGGQLLLKAGAAQLPGDRLGYLLAAFRNGHVLLGLAAWTASTVCWLYVLRAAPLSRAYGLTSLTYVLVFLGGVLFFGENVRRLHVAGTVLIVIGIVCLLQGD